MAMLRRLATFGQRSNRWDLRFIIGIEPPSRSIVSHCCSSASRRRRLLEQGNATRRVLSNTAKATKVSTYTDKEHPSRLKVWEFRVADEVADAAVRSGDDDDAKSRNKKRGRKATLYTSSEQDGWNILDTRLTSTSESSQGPDDGVADAQRKLPSLDDITVQFERNVLRHFLPNGYPYSVAPGYRNYVMYCFAANTCGSAAMVLSTQTLLLAVGVGSTSAAPMAAALNWVMKDGIGQLGGILFASRLGSAVTGSSIDSDPKRWRMASAISMDGATWLEILSPLFPGYFLPIASIANIGKNIGFLTASASRAAIHQALVLKKNLGDVTAKAGSQSIAASLAGTAIGIGLSPLMQGEVANVACGFAVLSIFHQACTYKALRNVYLRSLNRHRMNLVMEDFVRSYMSTIGFAALTIETDEDAKVQIDDIPGKESTPVLTPTEVAEIESFLPFISKDESKNWLTIGCKLNELFSSVKEFDTVRNECIGHEKYLLNCDADDAGSALVRLTYLENADGNDIMRGMLHAHVLNAFSNDDFSLSPGQQKDLRQSTSQEKIKASHGIMVASYDAFVSALEKGGWDTSTESVHVEAGSDVRMQIE